MKFFLNRETFYEKWVLQTFCIFEFLCKIDEGGSVCEKIRFMEIQPLLPLH